MNLGSSIFIDISRIQQQREPEVLGERARASQRVHPCYQRRRQRLQTQENKPRRSLGLQPRAGRRVRTDPCQTDSRPPPNNMTTLRHRRASRGKEPAAAEVQPQQHSNCCTHHHHPDGSLQGESPPWQCTSSCRCCTNNSCQVPLWCTGEHLWSVRPRPSTPSIQASLKPWVTILRVYHYVKVSSNHLVIYFLRFPRL